eukprot:Tamp_10146.p2 GENE.Tamp_10146~~Tamp_10146.p2  ORF type:complete len:315 (+),score=58.53 Tamp_10146:887-1831(+)
MRVGYMCVRSGQRGMQMEVLALVLVLRWAPQSTGSGLPVGTAQDFHVSSPEKQPLEAHRPANVLKLSPCGAAIRESVKHSPAFGTLHVELGAGASLRAEAGSMVCMQNIVSETVLAGPADMSGQVSCLPSLGRALLGDQSLYINVFRPGADTGGWVALAPNAPGDVVVHTIAADRELFIQRGSFMASWPNVETDAKFKGWKGMLAGEGLFFLRAYTTDGLAGKVFFTSYGAVERYDLKPGEDLVVDTGHIVAFEDTLSYSIARLGGGLTSFFMGGEGFVCRFRVRDRGPRTVGGSVWVQTRQPRLPGNNRGSGD